MDPNKTVVWILGAGFSKSLGGSLLEALLSPTSFKDNENHYSNAPLLKTGLPRLVMRLYSWGCAFAYGSVNETDKKKGGERLWAHAEDFLDYLDTAARRPNGARARRIETIVRDLSQQNVGVEQLRSAAWQLVAMECCAFLREADTESEKWRPYLAWANTLGPDDAIVTFNYDTVLERLEASSLDFIRGDLTGTTAGAVGKCPVYKLHGSVNWKRETLQQPVGTATSIILQADHDFAAQCDPKELVMGMPGPSKLAQAEELTYLWTQAMSAIAKADAVVFVGFRFPPTDAYGREKLLGALESNTASVLDVHVVLGPNLGHEHVVRVTALTQSVLERADRVNARLVQDARMFRVTPHPLLAEDFFTVWKRERLFWRPTEPGR